MPLTSGGMAKLAEEASEVAQVACKAIALGKLDLHWDGTNLRDRLEEEIADVEAIIEVVKRKHSLNRDFIAKRNEQKIGMFEYWDSKED